MKRSEGKCEFCAYRHDCALDVILCGGPFNEKTGGGARMPDPVGSDVLSDTNGEGATSSPDNILADLPIAT